MFFYGDQFNTANANYYQTFSNLTGWDSTQIDTNFRAMGTGMAGFAMYIQSVVYNYYSTSHLWNNSYTYTVCPVNSGAWSNVCAWGDMSNYQWGMSMITLMPMGDMDMSGWTYTTLYANYTLLTNPIELQYPLNIN